MLPRRRACWLCPHFPAGCCDCVQLEGGRADLRWDDGADTGNTLSYRVLLFRLPMAPALLALGKPTPPPKATPVFSGTQTRCRISGLVPGGAYVLQLQAQGVQSKLKSGLPDVILVGGAVQDCAAARQHPDAV